MAILNSQNFVKHVTYFPVQHGNQVIGPRVQLLVDLESRQEVFHVLVDQKEMWLMNTSVIEIPAPVRRKTVRKMLVKGPESFINFKQMFLQFDGQLVHGLHVQPLVVMEHNVVFSNVEIMFAIFLMNIVVIWRRKCPQETAIFVIVLTGRLANGKNARQLAELMFNKVGMSAVSVQKMVEELYSKILIVMSRRDRQVPETVDWNLVQKEKNISDPGLLVIGPSVLHLVVVDGVVVVSHVRLLLAMKHENLRCLISAMKSSAHR